MSKVNKVYLIHHSHTDIGYTHDQPIVWDLHGRFIEEAVRLAGKYSASETDGAFRWTVENTAVLYEWLKRATPAQVQAFIELERAGRIEVTGMFANLTPMLDMDQLIESFQLISTLRHDYGMTISSAMNCDVNGENWPLVDLLIDIGIEGFSMAINTHFGGAPLNRPNVFWWQGPSGRKILAYNGWPYDTGWRFGIGRSEEMFEGWWKRIEQRLDEIDYPIPALMMQSFHPFGDNGPAYEGFTTFIDNWNAKGKSPYLVMATPRMWWEEVKTYGDLLPTFSGDWTDFWNFGAISSAREQAINRISRNRLRSADAVAAATLGLKQPLSTAHASRVFQQYRQDAWKSLNLWDEHTWGADLSLRAPESEDTITQWYHKAHLAYQARSLSLMLQRDALADLSRHIHRQNTDDLLVFNPLPWTRTLLGEVPYHVISPRGLPEDATSGRHSQDRVWSTDLYVEAAQSSEGLGLEDRLGIPPVQVPGYGFTVINRSSLVELKPRSFQEDSTVENYRFRLRFDTTQGGVVSLYDKELGREWFDSTTGYPLNGFVHEEVADKSYSWPRDLMFHMDWDSEQVERERGWKPSWRANRRKATRVLTHRVYQNPYGAHIVQILEAPGIVGSLAQSVFLPKQGDYVEFESWWIMGQTTHPEGTYLMFPFDVPSAQARVDLGGQAMLCGADQIPGVCFDYFTAQQWVDLSNDSLGVTVALPENPMVQFGDFHFARNQQSFSIDRALLLSWVTNTYWETNFRTHQPGGVHARYRVYPHAGGFNPVAAYRWGMETAASQPLLQHMGEPSEELVYPSSGGLLGLPENLSPTQSIFTLHIKPASNGSGIIARFYNADNQSQEACLESGLLKIITAELCNLTEDTLKPLPVSTGRVKFTLLPRRVTTLHLQVEITK